MLLELRADIQKLSNPKKAKLLQGFFKTGPGEYGEGDIFLGLTVPNSRRIAKKYSALAFEDIGQLLKSGIHEERLIAILMLVNNFKKGNDETKEDIYDFYLKNTKYINNWDLVDLSAHKIVGSYLIGKDKSILDQLSQSETLWERRIAVIATFAFIRADDFGYSIKIAETLLNDEHDLIHKAVGWMLREVGKRSPIVEKEFLNKHHAEMPRTMLRYSIERFPEKERQAYLHGTA